MSDDGKMTEFYGTWRQLLEKLNGITDVNRNDDMGDDDQRVIGDMTDEELETLFTDSNGDGQSYYMVWDVTQGKQVLG